MRGKNWSEDCAADDDEEKPFGDDGPSHVIQFWVMAWLFLNTKILSSAKMYTHQSYVKLQRYLRLGADWKQTAIIQL